MSLCDEACPDRGRVVQTEILPGREFRQAKKRRTAFYFIIFFDGVTGSLRLIFIAMRYSLSVAKNDIDTGNDCVKK